MKVSGFKEKKDRAQVSMIWGNTNLVPKISLLTRTQKKIKIKIEKAKVPFETKNWTTMVWTWGDITFIPIWMCVCVCVSLSLSLSLPHTSQKSFLDPIPELG